MRWALFAGSAAFAVVAMAYDQYDKKTNFQPVNAHISAVNDQCYMEKVERGVLTKTTLTSDPLNCDLAKVLKREHPKWQGFAIRRKIEVRFDYVSPVDRAMHTSSQQMSAFPNDRPLRVGDTLPILASKTKADETHTI
jgi:hypothetical protein